ncbi:hypothetical protein F5Y03DRAFT_378961 [Xylaria venustula]|nr:hypothetical protein F5Y03DRAFT_378961 [Xylaria venustula]
MSNTTPPNLHPNTISSGYLAYSIATGVLFLLSAICVGLRLTYRFYNKDTGWDDWTILIALITNLGMFICNVLISLPSLGGAGYHIDTYTPQQLELWAKIGLGAEVLYNPTVSLAKISVLLFYKRIFPIDRGFVIFMGVVLFFIAAQFFSSVFGLIFTTNPVQAQWEVTLPHTTIQTVPFYITTAIGNILLDTAILAFAQVKLWNLKLDLKRKALLSVVFLVGALTIISSILRVIYLETVDPSDPTYSLTIPGIWTNVEASLGIVCACLPLVYSLFRFCTSGRKTRQASNSARRTPGQSFKKGGSLVTFGSSPSKFKRVEYSGRNDVELCTDGYEVICEPDIEAETHSMAPLDPVRIRREYRVTH